ARLDRNAAAPGVHDRPDGVRVARAGPRRGESQVRRGPCQTPVHRLPERARDERVRPCFAVFVFQHLRSKDDRMKRNALLMAVIVAIAMELSAFAETGQQPAASKGKQHQPTQRPVTKFKNLNFNDAANAEAKNPPPHETEVEEILAPQPPPDIRKGLPIPAGLGKLQTHAAPP